MSAALPIIWSSHAVGDLTDISEHISRSSPRYASVVVARIIAAVEPLSQFPELGHVVAELGEPNVRELIRGSYRIVYELAGERIEVLTVVHSSRRFPVVDESDG